MTYQDIPSFTAPILTGRTVRLEPLVPEHEADLQRAAAHPDIWTYTFGAHTRAALSATIAQAAALRESGAALAFAVIHLADRRAIGSTRYSNIMYQDAGLEIGSTWYAPEYWRTAVNTETKLLMLTHAFETWKVERVQLKTDARNLRSQRAIERLGAVREGVLRRHMRLPDDYLRDTVMYSVIREEWPGVRARLQAVLSGLPDDGA